MCPQQSTAPLLCRLATRGRLRARWWAGGAERQQTGFRAAAEQAGAASPGASDPTRGGLGASLDAACPGQRPPPPPGAARARGPAGLRGANKELQPGSAGPEQGSQTQRGARSQRPARRTYGTPERHWETEAPPRCRLTRLESPGAEGAGPALRLRGARGGGVPVRRAVTRAGAGGGPGFLSMVHAAQNGQSREDLRRSEGNELPEPEQDNGGTTESVKEQEMKWTDLALQYLHENVPPTGN
uniref:Anaphase-promoting complex subunit 13 n=1 Tax=Crocodylus porosus TaxID=8502 RepID=A0A7M4EPV1_CROPO